MSDTKSDIDSSVLSLKDVRKDNEKFRIDASYFAKLAVVTQERIEAAPHVSFGDICSVFRKGIFDIKADSYTTEGIPFVRISDLRNGLIDDSDLAFISQQAHKKEQKTALAFGDIVLSKTGYPAASFVNLTECNVSQDTIAVKVSEEGRKRFRAGYLVAYLNCRYGLALMGRHFQGNVQEHLSLPDGRKVPIPRLADKIQAATETAVLLANEQLQISQRLTAEGRIALVDAIGVREWKEPNPLTYVRRASQVFAAGRFDADFFAEKYSAARKRISDAGAVEFLPLDKLLSFITNGHTPLHHDLSVGDVPFLCAEHITDYECRYDSEKRIQMAHHQKELARTAVQNGDVLLTIKGRVGNAAIAERVSGPININQDVALLRLTDELPHWWVVAFINSRFGRLQVEQLSTGGINPFLGLSNVRKLTIPRFAESVMKSVSAETQRKIHAARAAKARAHAMLTVAKQIVEVAIEGGEKQALTFIERHADELSAKHVH